MTPISRSLLLSAALLAAPFMSALAQDSNPTGNYGSNRSMTASPRTADSKAKSGMNTADMKSRATVGSYSGAASNPGTPGGTGRTGVPGSNSSQGSASAGTANTQAGGTSGGK